MVRKEKERRMKVWSLTTYVQLLFVFVLRYNTARTRSQVCKGHWKCR